VQELHLNHITETSDYR